MADDASALGAWVIGLAAVAVLAGGASAAGGSGSSGAGTSSSTSARSATTTSRSAGTSATGTAASAVTAIADAVRPAPMCTGVRTVMSKDGKQYQQYVVSGSGSARCSLMEGDQGGVVAVLQRSLAFCTRRTVVVDGIFGPQTAGATAAQTGSRSYGPSSRDAMRWPWRYTATGAFTGTCSAAGARVS